MFRLAHLSDPHLGPLPPPAFGDLLGKRLTGYLNWRRGRARHHRAEVLDRLLADIRAADVDHVAVTGDLANIGLEQEYPLGQRFLERLGPPQRVTLVPGNHDAYIAASVPAMYRTWRLWLEGDEEPEGPRYAFPFVRRRGPLALVGLNSGVPTPAFMATGTLGPRQLAALADTLADLRQEGLARIVLVHHPPFDIGAQKRLTDHAGLAAVLRREGAELVLHGHTHKGTALAIPGPDGPIPVHGVPSASAAAGGPDEPAAWNLVAVDGEPGRWRIAVDKRPVAQPAAARRPQRPR